jgi:hypothetical protein
MWKQIQIKGIVEYIDQNNDMNKQNWLPSNNRVSHTVTLCSKSINRFSYIKMEEQIYLAWEKEPVVKSFVEEDVCTTNLKLRSTLDWKYSSTYS